MHCKVLTPVTSHDYHGRPTLPEANRTNEQLPLGLSDIPRRSRGGRVKHAHEDRNLQDHPQTRAKLEAYRLYLPFYLGKLGNTFKHVFINDLFAGSGRVRDGMDWADGSPIIACKAAAEAVADFASRGRSVRFSLRFVELRDDSRATLDRLVDPFRDVLDIAVLPGRAVDHIESVLAASEGRPAITFLDPDGFGVTFEQVTAFARPYGEVLLNFDVQGLLRTAGIVQTRSVSAFCGGEWWQDYRRNQVFDEDGFLNEYGRRIGAKYNYVSAERLEFPEVHANRAIVQGAYSVKAIDLWRREIGRSLPKNATMTTFDFVNRLDRSAQVNGALTRMRRLAGQRCFYGDIRRALGIFPAGHEETHQALYYLRDMGFVGWSSTLHARSYPAPVFRFGALPNGLVWDGMEREPERPTRSAVPVGTRG